MRKEVSRLVSHCAHMTLCVVVALSWGGQAVFAQDDASREALLQRIETLESRLRMLEDGGPTEAEAAPGSGTLSDVEFQQELLRQFDDLERRLSEIESTAVLSEPETRVREVQVWVDEDGIEYDEPRAGTEPTSTYRRERVYRRQTINEKLEEALAGLEDSQVQVGIDATSTLQVAAQTKGDDSVADGNAYALASADLFFAARIAQNTLFFADIVGLSGPSPDTEIEPLTLLNGYTARLSQVNEINLREAWIRTELFDQSLAVSLGRLDLTNYFDENAAANDESIQFISDALVNNPALGLSSNGPGLAAVYDPKSGFDLRLGVQQSNPDATSLSDSIFTLVEAGYVANPFSFGEGKYRVWYRRDNSSGDGRDAFGISLDQRLTPIITLFARYGETDADAGNDRFYSGGFQFQNGMVFNPEDMWGIGYAYSDLGSGDSEHLAEAYYNLHLTERLRLSLHLQHVIETKVGIEDQGYFLPGLRLQTSF